MTFVKERQTFNLKKQYKQSSQIENRPVNNYQFNLTHSPIKHQKQQSFHQKNSQFNQTQRKSKWSTINFPKMYSNQQQIKYHQDSPYFKDRVKTQTASFDQNNKSHNFYEKSNLLTKIQNEEERQNKHSMPDQLFKLQLQFESLQRNYNLLKKQLEQYKKKAYQKTETYMKLLQQSTQTQLNRFADIELLKLKIKQIQKQHQAKITKITQTNKYQVAADVQAINILKIELQKKQYQIQNLQRKKYQFEHKLQKLEQIKKESNQSKKIEIQSLLSRINQLEKYLQKNKIDNQHLFSQCQQLKEVKKQMEGQIHVLLAIQQKKSQDIQANNKKIIELQKNIRQLNYENLQLKRIHQKIHQKDRQIQFKNGQIEALKHREASLIQNEISTRQKTDFIIQKKHKQIQEFTVQNERLYKDLNRLKLSTSQLCIKYNIKEDVFKP